MPAGGPLALDWRPSANCTPLTPKPKLTLINYIRNSYETFFYINFNLTEFNNNLMLEEVVTYLNWIDCYLIISKDVATKI